MEFIQIIDWILPASDLILANFWSPIVGAAAGWIEGGAADEITKDNNKTGKQIAGYKNRARLSGNLAEAAKGGLARWVQSLNNQRHLKAGGESLEAAAINIMRQRDAGTRGDLSRSLASEEQRGAASAQQAAAGVRGSVVDTINLTTSLRQSMAEQAVDDSRAQGDRDYRMRQNQVRGQMINGLDHSVILDSLNYMEATYRTEAVIGTWGNILRGAAAADGAGAAVQNDKGKGSGASDYTNGETYGTITTNQQRETADFRFRFGETGTDAQARMADDNPYSLSGGSNAPVRFGDRTDGTYFDSSSGYSGSSDYTNEVNYSLF